MYNIKEKKVGNMKKIYVKPEMTEYNVNIPQIIASSPQVFSDESVGEDEVLTKEERGWGSAW